MQECLARRAVYAPLSRYNDGLPSPVPTHRSIRILRYRKQVRLELASLPPTIRLDDFWPIKSDTLERVHRNEHDPAICIDTVLRIAIPDRM